MASERSAYSTLLCIGLLRLGSANGASTLTSAAVDAGACVDNILAVTLGDSVYGAAVCARTARDAIVGNYVCHSSSYLLDIFVQIRRRVFSAPIK